MTTLTLVWYWWTAIGIGGVVAGFAAGCLWFAYTLGKSMRF